jgi:zinc protease
LASLIGAGNLAVGISGDFDPATVTTLLQSTLGKLPRIAQPVRAVGQPLRKPHPGVYLVDTPGASQGLVRIGHLGHPLGHPDESALTVLNRILGGGDFTSRMVKRIRSDEGLAYAAWSEMTFPSSIPGHFSAVFQSECSTVARATEITMDLVRQLRTDPVTSEELTTGISFLVDAFPTRFETPAAIVGTFAADELLDRPAGYWTGYRDRVRSVTADDIKTVASKHLDLDRMMILIVGNIDRIMEGHPDFKARISDFGPIKRLPLRDPMTLEPINGSREGLIDRRSSGRYP